MEELEAQGHHEVPAAPVSRDRPFATTSGKVELYSTTLDELGLDPLPGYVAPERDTLPAETKARFPLTLITGDREKSYHHSRFRDQAWALKVSPDPRLIMHTETALALGLADGDWVRLSVEGTNGDCRLRLKLSDTTPRDVVNTGMGWWRPASAAPGHGALDININAALSYNGPYDPISGSSDIRGQLCRVEPITA